MNRYTANERLWQFKPFSYQIQAQKLISVKPFCPKDVKIDIKNDTATIHGIYGIDIFSDHKFVVLLNGKLETYTKLEDIPQSFDNLIKFQPDDTHDITFTYTFESNGEQITYTHWVHHDMEVWEEILPQLIKRENNGGW